jgi:hypothetical protein
MIARAPYSSHVAAIRAAYAPFVRESTNLDRKFVLSRTTIFGVAL